MVCAKVAPAWRGVLIALVAVAGAAAAAARPGQDHRRLLQDVVASSQQPEAAAVAEPVAALAAVGAGSVAEPGLSAQNALQPEETVSSAQEDLQVPVGNPFVKGNPAGQVTPMFSRPGGSPANPLKFTWTVTIGTTSPDCVSRKIILVNNMFQPSFTLVQGDWVEIKVVNSIADNSWPSLFEGISIHWHGFSMKRFPWMDGVKYVTQCPIKPGSSFTYRFQVSEMPGTYFWHDHSSMNRADGLQGALIVKERAGVAPLYSSASDQTLFLSDHWHFTGNAMAMRLNRPFDTTKATNATGSWCWVGLPKSILLNGVGNYYDCEDPYKRVVGQPIPYRPAASPANATASDLLNPPCVAGQLGGGAKDTFCDVTTGNSMCSNRARTTLTVTPNKVHRIRLVNGATLVYMTVCFEKHNVTVITLDAAPVQPKTFVECVDLNSGQRVDVLLTANQPAGSYWISVTSQYRKGAPTGYGVLKYTSAAASSTPNPANIVQPGSGPSIRWQVATFNSFQANQALLAGGATQNAVTASYLTPDAFARDSFLLPTTTISQRYILQSTQPLIQVNGMLRWAFDNVAHASTPPCRPVLDSVYSDSTWAQQPNNVATGAVNNTAAYWGKLGGTTNDLYSQPGADKLEVVDKASANADVFVQLATPSAGTHVLTALPGQMIELVVQNYRAGFGGGEYPSNSTVATNARNGREQHSFHMHGYHFWQVGMGLGAWTPDAVATYNLVNPPMRDTTTVLFNGTVEDKAGWVAFRFLANNPGVWPMHCHIDWHMFMGQSINIISDPVGIGKLTVPSDMPTCSTRCMLNHANFNPNASAPLTAGMAAPPNSNLP